MNPMTERTPKKHKVWKWILGTLLIIALLLISASWYISIKLKPLIREEIKALVQKSTQGLYRIELSEIHTNFITGSATIGDVNIIPDTNVFNQLIKAQKAPNNLYYIRLKELIIRRFHPFALYFDKKVEISLLLFDKPTVVMVNKHFAFNDNRPPRPRKSPYDYISKLFKSLRVEVVDFKGVNFKYINNNGLVPDVDSVANLNVTLKDWLIDSLSARDTTRLYLLKDVNVNVSNYRYATPDSMYYISVNELDFNASTGKAVIKQLGVQPRHSETEFAKIAGYARDRFTILMNNISLNGINLPAYLQKKELIANQMAITDGTVDVFNNNVYPKLNKDRTGSFPHQLLQKLSAQLTIKKVNLSNIDISYAEFDQKSKLKGKITFHNTSGTLMNLTNSAQVKAQNKVLTADLLTDVMGQGRLGVTFKFDLNSPFGAFAYHGALVNMDGRKLNAIAKPLGMLQVNKGNIKKLEFNIDANQDVAKGKVDFRFNDLSVTLLKKKEGKNGLAKKALLSILANALIIYSDNPSSDGKFTSAKIDFKREPTASFFSFVWKTLFQGVKFSVGVTPQKEAEIKSQIAKFEQMKGDREERRMRRQLRKEKKALEKDK
jgi:hypothetical protein